MYVAKQQTRFLVKGALNAEIYGRMGKESMQNFIVRDVEKQMTNRLRHVHNTVVKISAVYAIIDLSYNTLGKVMATLTFSHSAGLKLQTVNLPEHGN